MGELNFKRTFKGKFILNVLSAIPQLEQDGEYDISITTHRNRRSLDANAYCWVLIDKLAVELSKEHPTTPTDVYRQLIPDVGGNYDIVPIKEEAVEAWKRNWEKGRTGWLVEDMGESKRTPGYHLCKCYYGSSVYDTKQMTRLINLVVQEAKQLGIETMSPLELKRLLDGQKRV